MELLFIVNPIAGGRGKKRIVDLIEKHIDRKRFTYGIAYTEGAGHATKLAAESTADVVVAVGGDGTVHEVAQGLMERGRKSLPTADSEYTTIDNSGQNNASTGLTGALGIIPCGSGNGLALELGISTNPVKAIRNLNQARFDTIDSGIVKFEDGSEVPFFNTAGIGINADVADNFSKAGTRGLSTYVKSSFKLWQEFKSEPVEVTMMIALEKGGTKGNIFSFNLPITMINICNISQWGNNVKAAPGADCRDGLLDVTIVGALKTADLPAIATKLLIGRLDKDSHVNTFRCSSISLVRSKEGYAHIDGEPFRAPSRMELRIIPSSLKVFHKIG